MTSLATDLPIERIRYLLQGILAKEGSAQAIGPAEALADAGVSSLDMVNLMLAIEADFDLFIPPEQVNPSNFKSLAAIAAMVAGLLEPSPGSKA